MKKVKDLYRKIRARIYSYLYLEQETAEGETIRALNLPHLGRVIGSGVVTSLLITVGVCGVPAGFISDFLGLSKSFAQKVEEKNVKKPETASAPKLVAQNFELKVIEASGQNPTPDIDKGAFVVARLVNKIVSENGATPVFAKVEKSVEKDGVEVIPSGALLIGNSKDTGSERRVYVDFHTVKFPDGKTHPFRGQLLSPDGSAGLAGEYTSGKGEKLAAAGIGAFVAGASAGLMTYNPGAFGGSTPEASIRNSMLGGVGNTANYATELLTEDMKNSRGVITVKPGSVLLVFMDTDFMLTR